MNEFDTELQTILEKLANGQTKKSDWTAIMDQLVGSNDAETINNIYKFVGENFSFKIPEGTEGYVYYGTLDSETSIWQVVEGVVKSSEDSYGYISSTEAGKLFNDRGFMDAVADYLHDVNVVDENFYNNAFNGTNASGVIELSDGTTVQAFNDFFSVNYINNLECSNVSTLLSGDYTINCFGRTEFQAILDNAAIKTINGIDKNVFYELYHAAPAGEEMTYIVDALKASEVSSLENIYYRIGAEGVEIVSKETEGAASLIDTLISGEKITSSSTKTIDEILSLYGDALSAESRTALQALAKNSESALFEILSRDSEAILSLAGKDSMQIGKFTITKGGQITEILADGTKVYTEATEITSAERAAAEGYTAVEGTGKTIFTKFKNGLIKVLDIALGIVLVYDASKTGYDAYLECEDGNYKNASKDLMSYGFSMLTSVIGSVFFMGATAAVCAFLGVVAAPFVVVAGVIGCLSGSFLGDKLGEYLGDYWCDLWGCENKHYIRAFDAVRYVADPLVIDLDGDGFEILSVKDGVYFDEDTRGLVEKTAWVSADDALLAIDLNEDGIINDGSELFGTSTILPDGTTAESGFAALAQYDENNDGVIDELDSVFSKLKVWQDKNGDGISQEDELYSLSDLGIKNISLDTSEEDGITVATINFENGTSTKIGEFDFDSELYNTIEKDVVEISDEILSLPDIMAIGSVPSLHTLMQLDDTGVLREYVRQFAESTSREEKEDLMTKILYFITGAEHIDPNSRGNQFDAQKLTVIEQFMGRDFVGTAGADPVNTAATILEELYTDIYNIYYSLLNSQTHLAIYMNMIVCTTDECGNTYLNTDLFNAFIAACIENGNDMTDVVAEMGRYIYSLSVTNPQNFNKYFENYANMTDYAKSIVSTCFDNFYLGTDDNNSYSGTSLSDAMFGDAGDDILYGNNGNDTVYGEEGNDSLYGGNGDDVLVGGKDNDYMDGGCGNDTYIFNIGDGADIIYEYELSSTEGKEDKIVFGEGIKAEDIVFQRDGNNLILHYSDTDQVTVKDAYLYNDGRCMVENIEFADGTTGTIDYSNACLNITYTETEILENTIDENSESTFADRSDESTEKAEESLGENFIKTSAENASDILDVDSLVNNCIKNLDSVCFNKFLYNSNTNEYQDYFIDDDTNLKVDNIVNLLVQDMSEYTKNEVSDVDTLTNINSNDNDVHLWTL